jgi:hypothetical protein
MWGKIADLKLSVCEKIQDNKEERVEEHQET